MHMKKSGPVKQNSSRLLIGIIYGANERASELSGYSYDELIGESIQILFTEEERMRVPLRYDLLKQGLVVRSDRILTRKDGSTVFIGMNTKMMPDGTYQTFIRDMSERKIAEDNLAAEKERLAVTLRSIGDGVITTDTDCNIVIMNKIAEELTGWSLSDAAGRALSDVFNIIDESSRLQCENPAEVVLQTGLITEIENNTILISRDGTERIISDSGAPIKDNNNVISGVVIVFRDMTEKRKLLDAVQQTDRLNSLGVLAGGIAHDFNNLLSGIFGYIEMARLKSTSDKVVMDYLDKAFTVFDRARSLTQQLLTFSKGGLPVRRTGNVALLIKESTAFALSGSNISCEFMIDEDLRLCDFDENQMAQVIDNIIINAKQAMPLGGQILVSVKNFFIGPDIYPMLQSGNYIKISISDTGIGIQQDHLKRIFDPFFTTKQQGNGLGLATCYSIIKKHDGLIEAKSTPGKGSEFIIYLPASEKEIDRSSYPVSAGLAGSGKILVMDDEDFIRDISLDMLKLLGYSAEEASDGEEALALLAAAEKDGKPFDGVILDLTIPGGMGGRETLSGIRKLYGDIPVFASSGFSEDPVISKPKDYGFTGSIRKPYRKDELAELLSKFVVKKK
ncbi:MAG: hybrid sensor histidine kinase/response regulator [Spirochaetae bacterium HGW-Spirochaetae-5]|nr:MAG: hybrid sensor histidine kinase/response regulator [Spirochaetae bacterium HGW-Spirochaetae-5]